MVGGGQGESQVSILAPALLQRSRWVTQTPDPAASSEPSPTLSPACFLIQVNLTELRETGKLMPVWIPRKWLLSMEEKEEEDLKGG